MKPVIVRVLAATLVCPLLPRTLHAQEKPATNEQQLTEVTVTGNRPTSLPWEIPTTIETIDAAQIARQINATDAEDALKYFPSLLVRKRYIGDYDHAILASRASGTGNSARSMVYADGILLSTARQRRPPSRRAGGMVAPEEIERVSVLYGPFSAAYPAIPWVRWWTTSRACRIPSKAMYALQASASTGPSTRPTATTMAGRAARRWAIASATGPCGPTTTAPTMKASRWCSRTSC